MSKANAYKIVHSNRKTIALIVERDRSLVVRAPHSATAEQIERVIVAKKLWIYEKTKLSPKYPLMREQKEFVSGESLLYLGRNYRLEVVDESFDGVQFRNKFLISRRNKDRAGKLFRAWYMERAQERLAKRAHYFATTLGTAFNRLLVTNLRYRWGSCTPNNNLNFNWRVIKAPSFVVDYLIVHELAHLLEPNHTKRFWNIVAVQVPQFERARTWLAENGDLLELDFS